MSRLNDSIQSSIITVKVLLAKEVDYSFEGRSPS